MATQLKQVNVLLSADRVAQIEERAAAMGLSRSKYVAALVEISLDSHSNKVAEMIGRFFVRCTGKRASRPTFEELEPET